MTNSKKKLVLNQETVLCLSQEIGPPSTDRPAPVGTRLIGCTYTK